MHFGKIDGFISASRITGPRHNLLQMIVAEGATEEPAFEFLPAVGSCTHPSLDSAAIVSAVQEAIGRVNEQLGTSYAPTRIRVPVNDTPPEIAYGVLAAAIVERLHRGEEFPTREHRNA